MTDALTGSDAAICRVKSEAGRATGYFVTPSRIVTTTGAIAGAEDVEVTSRGQTRPAKLVGENEAADVAILEVEQPFAVEPLPLEELDARVVFAGYGLDGGSSAVYRFDGLVLDPHAADGSGRTVLKLYCEPGVDEAVQPQRGCPIVVQGSIVGHWTRSLGTEGVEQYRVGFATPVAALRPLGIEPKGRMQVTEPLSHSERTVDALPEGQYHVLLSYRSTDAAVAEEMAELLEGAGLKVFVDQKELEREAHPASSLESAAAHSRAAVVLVSKGWLESDWCQREAKSLVERPGLEVVAIRVDESQLPTFFGNVSVLELGQEEDLGAAVQRLIGVLANGSHSRSESSIERAEARVLDAFRAAVRSAKNAEHLATIVEDWRSYGSSDRTVPLQAAERLVGLGHYTEALGILKRAECRGRRCDQIRALALDKSGETDEAISILERLYQLEHRDPETLGILAGIPRRRWKTGRVPAHLERAHQLYREGWEKTGDTYNGINTAHLLLMVGKPDEARNVARQVLDRLKPLDKGKLDHWQLATVAEAHLINRDLVSAKEWYGKAVAKEPDLIGDIGVMRAQAVKNLEAMRMAPTALDDVLFIPRVLAFVGHMEDAANRRKKRFPPEKVGAVRRAIKRRLPDVGETYAVCSAARGSDLIFLEELLKRGGRARVVLPFRAEDYKKTSVGARWNEKFDELVRHPRVKLVAPNEPAPDTLEGQQAAFGRANRRIYGEASKLAKGLGQTPRMLAVWDKKKGDGPGGTADAVEFWKSEGEKNKVDVINVRHPSGVLEPRRVAIASAAVLGLLAILTAVGWQTDVIVSPAQARGIEVVSVDVQREAGFDVNDSAGLFVGIREFKNFPEVPYAVDDAVDLAYLFALELELMRPENVVLGLSGSPQKFESRKRLSRLEAAGAQTFDPVLTGMFQEIDRVPALAGPKGLLVFAFATHGFADDGNHYLVMEDSVRSEIIRTGIPVNKLLDESSLARVPRSILFLDACQERLSVRGMTETLPSPEELYEALGNVTGIAVLAGTQLGGYSYDDRIAKNGVFTNAVIRGLGGAVQPIDQFITIRLLGDYVHEEVKKWIAVNRPQDVEVSRGIERRILGDASDLPLAIVGPRP